MEHSRWMGPEVCVALRWVGCLRWYACMYSVRLEVNQMLPFLLAPRDSGAGQGDAEEGPACPSC